MRVKQVILAKGARRANRGQQRDVERRLHAERMERQRQRAEQEEQQQQQISRQEAALELVVARRREKLEFVVAASARRDSVVAAQAAVTALREAAAAHEQQQRKKFLKKRRKAKVDKTKQQLRRAKQKQHQPSERDTRRGSLSGASDAARPRAATSIRPRPDRCSDTCDDQRVMSRVPASRVRAPETTAAATSPTL